MDWISRSGEGENFVADLVVIQMLETILSVRLCTNNGI